MRGYNNNSIVKIKIMMIINNNSNNNANNNNYNIENLKEARVQKAPKR